MKSRAFLMTSVIVVCFTACSAVAQQSAQAPAQAAIVPNLVSYGGVLKDVSGKVLTSLTGVTFLIYKNEQGGAPLWLETQNVVPDESGHYTVQLGSTSAHGLPSDMFQSGEARWLAVQVVGEAEQLRAQLVAVPYAMKATDAETLGGLPPSAFVQATRGASAGGNGSTATPGAASNTGTSAGTLNVNRKTAAPNIQTQSYVAKFINGTGGLGNSLIFDNGTNVGIGTTTPKDALDVVGGAHLDFSNLNNGTFGANLAFGDSTSGEGVSSTRGGGTTNKYGLDFWTFKQRRMSITSTGNVGIGTAAPTDAFDVVGSAHIDFANKNTGTSTPKLAFGDGSSGEGISSTRGAGTTNKYGLDFWTFNQRRMSITSTGNVGIGTATPAAMLDVQGTGNFTGVVTFAAGQTFAGNGSGLTNVNAATLGGNLPSAFATLGANSFTGAQTVAGNVILSNTVDTEYEPSGMYYNGIRWLDGSGNIQAHLHRFGAVDNNLYVTNDGASDLTGVYLASAGTSWTSTSDERLKTNIVGVTGILDKIKKIRVVSFDMAALSVDRSTGKPRVNRDVPPRRMKDGTVISQQIGSIAQDWVADFPQLVVEPQTDDQFYGLDYDRIGVVALGGVKELTALVEAKDAEIKALSVRLAALEQALRQLTQQSQPGR